MDFNSIFNTPDTTEQYDVSDIETNKVWAGISYLCGGVLFFLPLVAAQNSAFAKYHANQSLILFIFEIIAVIASGILGYIPLIGGILCWLIRVVCLVFMVIGLVNGFQGKAKSLPLIGNLFTIIK